MQIILANPRGFCAGVHMAINTVEEALRLDIGPLYVYHEIVHNRHVVEQFKQQDVTFIDHIHEAPAGSTIIFSAHGVSPEIRQQARDRQCRMIDATCPLVTKVHMEAIRYAKQGYRIILIGHAGHDEVVGTIGEAPDAITIVESAQQVNDLPFDDQTPLIYLTQTTLSLHDASVIIKALTARYPHIKSPPTEDICYATTNRQNAVKALAPTVDLVLVVGSQNSSNSLRLVEISEQAGTPGYLIDDLTELSSHWFNDAQTVLITSGASAPEHLVQALIDHLQSTYQATLLADPPSTETVHFNLPQSLRRLKSPDVS